METTQIEMKRLEEASAQVSDDAVTELNELQLVLIGGGGAIAQFG
jgi:hypothetical protein